MTLQAACTNFRQMPLPWWAWTSHVGKGKLIAWSLYRSCKVLVGNSWLKAKENYWIRIRVCLSQSCVGSRCQGLRFTDFQDDRILSQSMHPSGYHTHSAYHLNDLLFLLRILDANEGSWVAVPKRPGLRAYWQFGLDTFSRPLLIPMQLYATFIVRDNNRRSDRHVKLN